MNPDLTPQVLDVLIKSNSTTVTAFLIEQARGHVTFYETQLKYWKDTLAKLEKTSLSDKAPSFEKIPSIKTDETGRLMIPQRAAAKSITSIPAAAVVNSSSDGKNHVEPAETNPISTQLQPLTVEDEAEVKEDVEEKASALSHFTRPSVKGRSNKFVRKVNFDGVPDTPSSEGHSQSQSFASESSFATPSNASSAGVSMDFKTRSAAPSIAAAPSLAAAAAAVVSSNSLNSTNYPSKSGKSIPDVADDSKPNLSEEPTQPVNKFSMFENMTRNSTPSVSSRPSYLSLKKENSIPAPIKEVEVNDEIESNVSMGTQGKSSSNVTPQPSPTAHTSSFADVSETPVQSKFAMFENKAKNGTNTLPIPQRGRSQTFAPVKSAPGSMTSSTMTSFESSSSTATTETEKKLEVSESKVEEPSSSIKSRFAMFADNPNAIPMRPAVGYSSATQHSSSLSNDASTEGGRVSFGARESFNASSSVSNDSYDGRASFASTSAVSSGSGYGVPPPIKLAPPPILGASGNAVPPPMKPMSSVGPSSVKPPAMGVPMPGIGVGIPKREFPPPLVTSPTIPVGPPQPLSIPKPPSPKEHLTGPGPPPIMPPPVLGGYPPMSPPPMSPPPMSPAPMMPPPMPTGGPPPMMPPPITTGGNGPSTMPPPLNTGTGGLPMPVGGPPPMPMGGPPPRGGVPMMGSSNELSAALNRRKQTSGEMNE